MRISEDKQAVLSRPEGLQDEIERRIEYYKMRYDFVMRVAKEKKIKTGWGASRTAQTPCTIADAQFQEAGLKSYKVEQFAEDYVCQQRERRIGENFATSCGQAA